MLITELKAADLEAVRNHPMRHFFPHRRPELY
jgi:N-carbamoylputrescine amidase